MFEFFILGSIFELHTGLMYDIKIKNLFKKCSKILFKNVRKFCSKMFENFVQKCSKILFKNVRKFCPKNSSYIFFSIHFRTTEWSDLVKCLKQFWKKFSKSGIKSNLESTRSADLKCSLNGSWLSFNCQCLTVGGPWFIYPDGQ
jgi:hypothetical protein